MKNQTSKLCLLQFQHSKALWWFQGYIPVGHLRKMTETNIWMIPSSKYWDHLSEPLKWLKMPTCWVLFCFRIFLSVKPLFCGVIIYLTCIVIQQTKPTSMGIHHVKGFWDTLTYKTYTSYLKIGMNFWTPCISFQARERAYNLTESTNYIVQGVQKLVWLLRHLV